MNVVVRALVAVTAAVLLPTAAHAQQGSACVTDAGHPAVRVSPPDGLTLRSEGNKCTLHEGADVHNTAFYVEIGAGRRTSRGRNAALNEAARGARDWAHGVGLFTNTPTDVANGEITIAGHRETYFRVRGQPAESVAHGQRGELELVVVRVPVGDYHVVLLATFPSGESARRLPAVLALFRAVTIAPPAVP